MFDFSIWHWTTLFALVFIILGLVIFIFRMRQDNVENDRKIKDFNVNSTPQSVDNQIEKRTDTEKNKRLLISMVLGVAVFIVALVFFSSNTGGVDQKKDSFSMLPIWVAVFVPLIATKSKKNRKLDELTVKQKELRKIIILFVIGFIMAMTMIFIFLAK